MERGGRAATGAPPPAAPALAFGDVAVFAGGHGVLPEDFFAALDVADELGGVVFVFEDELAELHVVEVDVAFADVEAVDACLLFTLDPSS